MKQYDDHDLARVCTISRPAVIVSHSLLYLKIVAATNGAKDLTLVMRLAVSNSEAGLPIAGKRANLPPLGLMTVAAILPQDWLYRLVDLNIEELTDADLEKITGTYHAWRGDPQTRHSRERGNPVPYSDIPGFCKSASTEEIAAHGHVLTPGRYVGAEAVERAHDAHGPAVDDVRVDHRRGHGLVAQEGLDGADVRAGLEQVRREAVAEGVAGDALGDAGEAGGGADGLLDDGLVEVVAAALAGLAVRVAAGRGEDPLPGEVAAGLGEGFVVGAFLGQRDASVAHQADVIGRAACIGDDDVRRR